MIFKTLRSVYFAQWVECLLPLKAFDDSLHCADDYLAYQAHLLLCGFHVIDK
jgi:hypothetical protein